MDGGAWWAAVYGIAQSRSQLMRLSSSSSSMIDKMVIFLSREGRDLGVAFQAPPGSQAKFQPLLTLPPKAHNEEPLNSTGQQLKSRWTGTETL